MFTGLIERTGQIIALTGLDNNKEMTRLIIDPGAQAYKTKLGDSIAVNGACLTVAEIKHQMLIFDISSETLRKTSLGLLREGDHVNLERAMALGDRLGGHMVSGHTDGTGVIHSVDKNSEGWLVRIKVDKNLSRYIIPKGSICLDGVSLTVNSLEDRDQNTILDLMLIPKTLETTTFSSLSSGQTINVEVDMVGKFLERLNQPHLKK